MLHTKKTGLVLTEFWKCLCYNCFGFLFHVSFQNTIKIALFVLISWFGSAFVPLIQHAFSSAGEKNALFSFFQYMWGRSHKAEQWLYRDWQDMPVSNSMTYFLLEQLHFLKICHYFVRKAALVRCQQTCHLSFKCFQMSIGCETGCVMQWILGARSPKELMLTLKWQACAKILFGSKWNDASNALFQEKLKG